MKLFPVLSAVSFAALVVGCSVKTSGFESSSSATDPSSSGDIDSYCESICEKQHDCDTSEDKETCVNKCQNEGAAVAPHVRGDLLSNIASCVGDSDCKSVLKGSAENSCAAEELAKLSPSDAATSFCTALKDAGKKCGLMVDKASCLKTAKTFNDASLEDAEACTEKSCSAQSKCIGAAFGGGAFVSTSSSVSETETETEAKDAGVSTSETDAGKKTPDPDPKTCTAITGKTTCDLCRADYCCSEATAMKADSYYSYYQQCLTQYGSAAESYCANQYSTIRSKLQALNTCSESYCYDECP